MADENSRAKVLNVRGHSSRVSTTANVYTHVSAAESQALAEALESAIFPFCL
jgi:hypothetical protein